MNSQTGRGERRIPRAARLVPASSEEFPAQLRELPGMPPALWMRGEIRREDALAVAVVGARRATPYGLEMATRLGGELARRGVTVVSGLARGNDTAAHRAALRAGGRTIAVLGCGVDRVYPPENRTLMDEIAERGAIVSEFPLGAPPLPQHFPQRNRVIAGLSLAVVVVEAAERSGSLSTASWAADLGREVMAVPGRVTAPESRGCHRLLKDGATLVEDWEDVVSQLPAEWRACLNPTPVSRGEDDRARTVAEPGPDPEGLLGAIGDEPLTIDAIIERSGVASGRVAALLLDLELDGRVRQLPGKRFVRAGGA